MSTMWRVFIPNLNRWIENIPLGEALVYKEEGYLVERMEEETDDFDFTWGYRIVNTKSANGGEDWYCLQEVTYRNGKPEGYGAPCTGSEDMESMKEVWRMMEMAMNNPPLQEEDFSTQESNDE